MCHPASFVLTKTGVFWSMLTDSHTEIIAEHKLHEDGVRGVNVVKVEISPSDGDLSSDPATWVYKLDQDSTPDWYDAAECERRARVELAKWVAARVITSDIDEIKEPGRYWVFAVVGSISDGVVIVNVRDSGRVVNVRDSGRVDNVRDSGRVDNVWGSGRVDNVRDSGRVVNVWGSGRVDNVWGSGRVDNVRDSATVCKVSRNATVAAPSSLMAVVIDRTGSIAVCSVGADPVSA